MSNNTPIEGEVLDSMPVAQQAPAASGLEAALQQAMVLPDQGVERLERLWQMHKEMQDRDAAREYAAAMQRVQAAMPNIPKRGFNPQTKSPYARLEDMVQAITPVYTREGFSLSFGTVQSELEWHVGIVCDVLHSGGHSRTYTYDAPIDDAGIKGEKNKTPTHGRGSAISYGQRYLTRMIFNLTLGGEDDDGNAAGTKPANAPTITKEQAAVLRDLVDAYVIKKDKFFDWIRSAPDMRHVQELEDVPAPRFQHIHDQLNRIRKQREEADANGQ